MYHTVGKLAALAVVVGIGVAVVIHAQRGMPPDETAAESKVGESSGASDELADAELPAQQGEPEFAADDDADVVPAESKMRSPSGRDREIVTTSGGPNLNAIDQDDDDLNLSAPRGRTTADPFASGDDDAIEPQAKSGRASPRASAAAGRPRIDILDMDDDSPANTGDKDPSPASKRPAAARSRGAVLSLDDLDEQGTPSPRKKPARSKSAAGPRLLGGTDDSDNQVPSEKVDDDLFPDEEPPPAKKKLPASVALDDDLDTTDDIQPSAPPRKLPDDMKLKGSRRDIPRADMDDEDELSIDRPTRKRSEPADDFPSRTNPGRLDLETEPDELDLDLSRKPAGEDKRPAELNRTIEIDESIPSSPAPGQAPLPQITIEKQAPATAVLGRSMVYYIHVRNVGTIPAHQVVVEDVIPTEVQIDGSIPQAVLKDDRLIWKLGTLPAGQEKKIAVRVIPQSEGTIGGVATVNFAREPQRPRAQAPLLKFDVTAPKQASVGTPVEFHFHVRNVGSVPASGVTIRDVLPAGLKHPDGDDLEYNLGELPAGKSQEIKLTLTAAQAGPTINRVVVTADGDVAEEAQVQLDVVGPTLLVARNGPKKLIPNKTASFSNTVTNPGRGQVTGVTVVEKIPPGMEFVEAGDGGVYDQTKRSVFWTIKQLNAGEFRTVSITLRAGSRGAQISVIRAYDSSGSTGEATGATKVSGVPALTIEIGELPALVEAGETVKVPVRILNRGSDTATAVRATISVPSQLKILSAEGPTSYRERPAETPNGGAAGAIEVQFAPIERIEPKADAVFEVTVRAGSSGALHIDVQAQCDQLPDPIRRQEVINVAE